MERCSNIYFADFHSELNKYLGPKTWELIPGEMKELKSLWEFKRAIEL